MAFPDNYVEIKDRITDLRRIFFQKETTAETRKEIIAEIDMLYMQFIAEEFAAGKYPAYQASGMAFIRLANQPMVIRPDV